ncbi:hypothetical protein K458DRAFT_475396 [Lentithecium fluviatile CBS 122367]|uniref:Uncharacterized protein n=1 Tax=Lentithecium fluviatile CBS 122367 TaxID=1168545 RepID=A0A6G1JER6_9PLEO|nr:hypothetical protein K458DRAFT_475396 [Lentithecium fluviatile CBS 122367]
MLFGLLTVSAAVLLNGRTVAAASGGTPCSSVSSMSSKFMESFPTATQALVPGQAAEDCLRTVPIDKSEDLALLDELKLYINWQSNLAYLREPPEGYNEPRVDVIDELDSIRQNLEDDKYEDEYTLLFDVSTALIKCYDFHFGFRPDIRNVFRFRRGNTPGTLDDEFAVVSVSSDGKELPKLYNYYDIMFPSNGVSPIAEINNQSAEEYLQKWSDNFEYHEDHARYNRLFPNQAQQSTGSMINFFSRANIPDGDYTYVVHENKTEKKYYNYAVVEKDLFDGVEDGEAFFTRFLNQGPPTQSPTKKNKRAEAEATATGYPEPVILHSEAVIGGYYLSGSGYDDVAVLSVPSFSPETDEGPAEFQDLIGSFLKDATGAGKKKLVIDLRGNGGGRVFLGYDLFKQLFPSMDPYGASTFRANEAFNITGLFFTEFLKDVTYEDALDDFDKNGLNSNLAGLWYSIFNYRNSINIDGSNFTSWEDYFGPEVRNGDNFTVPQRKDLNNFFSDDLSIDVTGYRTRADKLDTNQPFEADNIVLLQDGGCGSTCAVFAEFMKMQGGVQQVVVGGKPETGPMQGVAGSKGSQVYSFTQVYNQAALAWDQLPDYQEQLNETEVGALVYANRPLMRSAYQSNGQTSSGINLRDNIRMNDTTVTPLEFVYEAADCRIFYTADMYRDVTNVWMKTADARWGDSNSVCIEGSTGHESSISGGFKTLAAVTKKSAAPTATKSSALMGLFVGLVGALMVL